MLTDILREEINGVALRIQREQEAREQTRKEETKILNEILRELTKDVSALKAKSRR